MSCALRALGRRARWLAAIAPAVVALARLGLHPCALVVLPRLRLRRALNSAPRNALASIDTLGTIQFLRLALFTAG